jgi:acetylglutamate kinase
MSLLQLSKKTLSGEVNKEIVIALKKFGVDAVGLSGVDGHLLEAQVFDPALGNVGKVTKVNSKVIECLLETRFTPVISPVSIDSTNLNPLNVNADWAAIELAKALDVDHLIYLSDQDGILDQNKNLIVSVPEQAIDELIQKEIVYGGMLVKVQSIKKALSDIPQISLLNGKVPQNLIDKLVHGNQRGTTFIA